MLRTEGLALLNATLPHFCDLSPISKVWTNLDNRNKDWGGADGYGSHIALHWVVSSMEASGSLPRGETQVYETGTCVVPFYRLENGYPKG